MGQIEIRIALTGDLQCAIGLSPQARGEAVIGAKAIEGDGRTDQLLIGRWNARPCAIEISEQAATAVSNADAPHGDFTPNR